MIESGGPAARPERDERPLPSLAVVVIREREMVQFAGRIGLHFLRSLELPLRAPTSSQGRGEKGFCGGQRPPQKPPLIIPPLPWPQAKGGEGQRRPEGAESVNRF